MIEIKYDYERKGFYITLDNTKRIIKDFLDINIDAIIVEILPEDNIEENYEVKEPGYFTEFCFKKVEEKK